MPLLPAGAAAYVTPYAAFLVIVELSARLPGAAPLLLPLRVALPAVLLFAFWRRGAYAELRGHRFGAATALDVACGLAIAALWVAPYLLVPSLARKAPFDADQLGAEHRALALGLRLAGFACVTPFVEELFVRSFVTRFAASFERGDFRLLPLVPLGARAFVVSALWFTFTHAPWEWWVALPTGIALNAWLMARRHLVPCIVAHAVANAALWALVVLGPWPLWEFL
jgi:CAAX prenyl protease-like protein